MKKLKNQTLEQVQKLARGLGVKARKKDMVIGLIGPLGSGKTTFTKSFAKALGFGKITSPTFIVMASYRKGKISFYHLDFYRLSKFNQLRAIGLSELLAAKNRKMVIEWIDKFPKLKKSCDYIIKFKINKNGTRDVTIS